MNALRDHRRWCRWRVPVLRAVVGAVGVSAVDRPNTVMGILRALAAAAAPPLAVHVVPHKCTLRAFRIAAHRDGARLG